MARGSTGDQTDALRRLFRVGDEHILRLAVDGRDGAALGDGEFGFDLRPVLLDHVIDPEGAGAFFPGLGEKDDIAVQLDIHALQQQQDHDAGDDVGLIVARPAGGDDSALIDGRKGIDGPFVALHADHVGVAHQQQGPLLTIALDARHQIGAAGVHGEHGAGNTLAAEQGADGGGSLGFVAGGIAGIDLQQLAEGGDNLGFQLTPVHGVTVLRGERGTCEKEADEPLHSLYSAMSLWCRGSRHASG